MPTLRKVTRGAETIHNYGRVAGGETIDVDADTADYLADTTDYERVDTDAESDTADDTTADTGDTAADADGGEREKEGGYLRDADAETQIDAGVCPWCDPDDRYEGESVGRHASSAHPEKWTAHKEATE